MKEERPAWIVQRCITASRNEHEDWPGYFERLMTREEMKAALLECAERWPEYGFRGHNAENQAPRRPTLRLMK